MHYIALSNSFGQFDRDDMYRYEFAGYANWASTLLDAVQADPRHWKVAGLQSQATYLRRFAVKEFQGWDYLPAACNAWAAYQVALRAATSLGIDTSVATPLRTMAVPASVPHEVDPIRFPGS